MRKKQVAQEELFYVMHCIFKQCVKSVAIFFGIAAVVITIIAIIL